MVHTRKIHKQNKYKTSTKQVQNKTKTILTSPK